MRVWHIILIVFGLFALLPVESQSSAMATTHADTDRYITPDGLPLALSLPPEVTLTVHGRSDTGLWLNVSAETGGDPFWVYLNDVDFIGDLSALPILAQQVSAIDDSLYPDLTDDLRPTFDRLATTPVFHNFDAARLAELYAEGRAFGNNPRYFMKIGDSNSTAGDFLRPLGMRNGGCVYGAFGYLTETVDFFNASPRERFDDPFDSTNVTAQNGLNTSGLLDPFWAPSDQCVGGESPLACEYRIGQPSVAVIMIGLMDLEQVTIEIFDHNLRRIIEELLGEGVIPVLTTFSVLPDYPDAGQSLWAKSVQLNAVMVDVSDAYAVPLINLWSPLQTYPEFGIGPDRTHIRHELGAFCDFTGPEAIVGGTLRNLLTLQALDWLRVQVIEVADVDSDAESPIVHSDRPHFLTG